MTNRNIIFEVIISLITSFFVLSYIVPIYAQNISSQATQWFVPLDLGKQLKIRCDGSLVDFVSDCNSPINCKSLKLAANDILECIPDSEFKNTDDQVIFP